jgi:hypothetical protein
MSLDAKMEEPPPLPAVHTPNFPALLRQLGGPASPPRSREDAENKAESVKGRLCAEKLPPPRRSVGAPERSL